LLDEEQQYREDDNAVDRDAFWEGDAHALA
jgi:hypothetical protein